MIPFSSIDFFVVAAIIVAYLYLSKFFLSKIISYSNNILFTSLFFLVCFFPKSYQLFGFIAYTYLISYLFLNIIKSKTKLLGSILLLLPMIIVKTHTRSNLLPYPMTNLDEFISFAGLSYISFRVISVYIDTKPRRSLGNIFNYISYLIFIPTILIGPIDRLSRFSSDLKEGYSRLNSGNFIRGWECLMIGILFKYVCAEFLDRYLLAKFDHSSKMLSDMTINMYSYYFYLFFDFAGYSAMAIGIGKMMGIDVPINFDKPFIARNPPDFWKRFHKTLGDWLRDYFFNPFYMFFSRIKRFKKYPLIRQNISLFLTFLLMGCWNGFQKNFIVSGIIFGIYSVIYNSYVFYCKKKQRDIVFGNLSEKTIRAISILITFHAVAFSIYVFSGRCPLI